MRHHTWNHLGLALALLVSARAPSDALAQGAGISPTPPAADSPPTSAAPAVIIDPATGMALELNVAPAWSALLAEAKAAEDGDNDFGTASSKYQALVRIFQELRPIAAEALYRYGVVEGRRNNAAERDSAYIRLIQWFPDFPDYAKKAQASRATERTTQAPAPGMGGSPPTASYTLSPALMARYGLSTAPAAGHSEPMPPAAAEAELRRRYGIGNPRYGIGNPNDPAANAATSDTAPGSSDPDDFHLQELKQQRQLLLSESTRIAAELRRARMELQRVSDINDPQRIPPNLVNDSRLRALIEAIVEPPNSNVAIPDEKRQADEERRLEALTSYFKRIYLPRLETTVSIQSRELDMTRAESTKLDAEIRELTAH